MSTLKPVTWAYMPPPPRVRLWRRVLGRCLDVLRALIVAGLIGWFGTLAVLRAADWLTATLPCTTC